MHTHSPDFSNTSITLEDGIEKITASYKSALQAYIQKFPGTGSNRPPLHLCCISASIYGGALANKAYGRPNGHIEPSVSIACVAKAIAQIKLDDPSDTLPPIDLFFWENQDQEGYFKTEVKKDIATVERIKNSVDS